MQIVTAPVTDGSLSSCPPAEAVTWGKVDKDTYLQTTESMQCDYSMVMPFLVKALLDNRARYEEMAAREGEEALFAREPKARGYLRPAEGYRLFEQRDELYRVSPTTSARIGTGCWRAWPTRWRQGEEKARKRAGPAQTFLLQSAIDANRNIFVLPQSLTAATPFDALARQL